MGKKTYHILNLLVPQKYFCKIAKGVYCRPKITRFGEISSGDENILDYYIGKEKLKGIVIGYKLYNKYGITTQVSKTIEIYSNMLEEEKKNINNIKIKKINLLINLEIKKAIEQLEILQHYNEIEDVNENKFKVFISTILESYSDEVFINVLSNIKYKKRTIAFLESILNTNNKRNTISRFLNRTSKYKIPEMGEILN